jgi:hypothetical protein
VAHDGFTRRDGKPKDVAKEEHPGPQTVAYREANACRLEKIGLDVLPEWTGNPGDFRRLDPPRTIAIESRDSLGDTSLP